jgi:hypothetical protein
VSVKEATHEKLVECSNALEVASIPDAIDTLATQFLSNKKSREDLRKLQEREVRGS